MSMLGRFSKLKYIIIFLTLALIVASFIIYFNMLNVEERKIIGKVQLKKSTNVNITYIDVVDRKFMSAVYNYTINNLIASGYRISKVLASSPYCNATLLIGEKVLIVGTKDNKIVIIQGNTVDEVMKAWRDIL